MDEQKEQARLDGIENGLKSIVAGEFSTTRPRLAILPREQIKLRCQSIVTMAFNTWMHEVRGVAPFTGPHDVWKLNQMLSLLFSIGENNGEFDKGEKK